MSTEFGTILKAWVIAFPPFAVVLFFIGWYVALLRYKVTSQVIRNILAVVVGSTVGGLTLAQIWIYRSMSGHRVLEHDYFFLATYCVQNIALIWIWTRRYYSLRRGREK